MFLPVVMAAYFICPARFRNIILLASSLFFLCLGRTDLHSDHAVLYGF